MAPTVSALYIVKNEEEFLPFSLASIHKAVDEIIVVDNESRDRTPEIAARFSKVKLIRSAARDFATLRNTGLEHVATDWLMWLDADEVFYPDLGHVLPSLVRRTDVDAYYCWFFHLMRSFWYMQNSSERDGLYHRLFLVRVVPGLRWEGPVHERLVGIGPNRAESGLHYVHYGYTKPQREVFRRWLHYASLEGIEHIYQGVDPDHILDDRPLYPFTREHPPVIRGYVERKAAELARQGYHLFRKPGT